MPISVQFVLKQVCDRSKYARKCVSRFSQRIRSYSARSQVMSAALVRGTSPIPCSSPADAWLKAAPRGAAKSPCSRKVLPVVTHYMPCSMQEHTPRPGLSNRTKFLSCLLTSIGLHRHANRCCSMSHRYLKQDQWLHVAGRQTRTPVHSSIACLLLAFFLPSSVLSHICVHSKDAVQSKTFMAGLHCASTQYKTAL